MVIDQTHNGAKNERDSPELKSKRETQVGMIEDQVDES
jgi:hypothetical protein